MHKQQVNELTLEIAIRPDGPILIKSGERGQGSSDSPHMTFVRTGHPKKKGENTIYLPGASLKGVIRSYCESVIRTVFQGVENWHLVCCDPLTQKPSGDHPEGYKLNCGDRIAEDETLTTTSQQYQALCLACRIFGHTVQASHFCITDGYPLDEAITNLPVRDGVGIDRLTGSAKDTALFNMEFTNVGTFITTLTLYNFELWQLGLLAIAFRDLNAGRVRIGFGKSRGFGKVKVAFRRLEIAYPGHYGKYEYKFAKNIYGVSALAKHLVEDYGYMPDDEIGYEDTQSLLKGSKEWGRPTTLLGLGTKKIKSLSKEEQEEEAHKVIEDVLAETVSRWVNKITSHPEYRK